MNSNHVIVAVLLLASACAAQKNAAKPFGATKADIDAQLYRNSDFGFHIRIPYGWVDRTKDLQRQDGAGASDQSPSSIAGEANAVEGDGNVLLAVFERPPQAAGDSINSAVVIATESAGAYPGLKSAENYLVPLNEITAAKGFKPDGDPQEITVDSRRLVRADYSKAVNDKLTMYQATLVLLEKKKIVSFTFVAGSKDEIGELVDSLTFEARGSRFHK